MTRKTSTLRSSAAPTALALASFGLFAASASAAPFTWQGGTGNFTDANWDDNGTADKNHVKFSTGAITSTIGGGTVNGFNNTNTGDFGSDDSLTITGGASVFGDFLQVKYQTPNAITLESGTITMSAQNAFRGGDGFPEFSGALNFTGAAGSATVVQTNNTGGAGSQLAGKLNTDGGTKSFFGIDGIKVVSGVTYDGTNIAAVNAGLENTVINGRYFQIVESSGTQTLTLVAAVPEPGSLALIGLGGLCMLRRRRN